MNGGRFISDADMGKCGCCTGGKAVNCRYNIYFIVFLKLYKDNGLFTPDPNDDDCTRLNKQRIHTLESSPYGCCSNPLPFLAIPPQFNIDKCSTTKDTTIINKIRTEYCECYGEYTVPQKIIININGKEEINDEFDFLALYRQKFKTIKQNCGSFDYERSFASIFNDYIHPSISYDIVDYKTGNTFYKPQTGGLYNSAIKDESNYVYVPVHQISYIKLFKTDYIINSNIFYCGNKRGDGIGETYISQSSFAFACDEKASGNNIVVNLLQKYKFDLDLDKLIENEKLDSSVGNINIIYPIFIDTDYEPEYVSRPAVNASASLKVEQAGEISISRIPSDSIGLSSKLTDFSAFVEIVKSLYECGDTIEASVPDQPYECINLNACPDTSTAEKVIKNKDVVPQLPSPQIQPNTYIRRVFQYWPNGRLQPPAEYVHTIPIIGSTFAQKLLIQSPNGYFSLQAGGRFVYYTGSDSSVNYGFTEPISNFIDKCGNEVGEGYRLSSDFYVLNNTCKSRPFAVGGSSAVSKSTAKPSHWPNIQYPVAPYTSNPAGTNAGVRLTYEEDPYEKATAQGAILACYLINISLASATSQYLADFEGSICDSEWRMFRNPDFSIYLSINIGLFWPNNIGGNSMPGLPFSRLLLEELYINGQYIAKFPYIDYSVFKDDASIIIPFISEVKYTSD